MLASESHAQLVSEIIDGCILTADNPLLGSRRFQSDFSSAYRGTYKWMLGHNDCTNIQYRRILPKAQLMRPSNTTYFIVAGGLLSNEQPTAELRIYMARPGLTNRQLCDRFPCEIVLRFRKVLIKQILFIFQRQLN